MNKNKKSFHVCDCGSHGIELDKWTDEESLSLYFWYHGGKNRSLIERIEIMWHVITGKQYMFEDMVVNKDGAKGLGEKLIEFANIKEDIKGD